MPGDIDLGAAFDGLSDDLKRRLSRAAVERRVGRGRTLFRAGDEADALYVVLSGRFHVSRETPQHVELLHTEQPGGVLGEIPVFGGGRFPATAVALTPSRCAVIPRSAIEALLRESPEFSRFAITRLAHRAQSLLRRIDELTAGTVSARVAQFILLRADGRTEFDLGVSQSALAEELGTARELVVRAIADLIKRGALERVGGSRFVLSDGDALRVPVDQSRPGSRGDGALQTPFVFAAATIALLRWPPRSRQARFRACAAKPIGPSWRSSNAATREIWPPVAAPPTARRP